MGLQELIDKLTEMSVKLGEGNADRKVLTDHTSRENDAHFAEVVDVQFRHGFQLILVTR